MVLYILKFKDFDLVKIGITGSLIHRVMTMQRDLKVEFDFYSSIIITAESNSRIKSMERQMLHDLKAYKIKQDNSFSLPKEAKLTLSELRTAEKIPVVIKLLEEKVEKLNLPIKIHRGLNISGVKSKKIPEGLIPPNYPVYEISNPISDEINVLCEKEGKSFDTLLYEICYEWFLLKGVEFKNENPPMSDTCYYVL